MRVHKLGIENCSTTCLFAAVTPTGALVVAQLGDGLAAILPPGGKLCSLAKEREGFANQTTGLGIARSTTDWSVVIEPNPEPETLVLLTTDGVADDLLPERLDELIVHLSNTFRALPKRSRSKSSHGSSASGRRLCTQTTRHWHFSGTDRRGKSDGDGRIPRDGD